MSVRPVPHAHSCGAVATYRPFFVAALLFMLTTGAGWGLHFLTQVAITGKATGVSLTHINAHGHTLIYGFVGMFILGFACQSFPRLWGHPLPQRGLIRLAFAAFTMGILLFVSAQLRVFGEASPVLALVSGAVEAIALLIIVGHLAWCFVRGGTKLSAPFFGIFAGFAFFVLHTVLGAWLASTQLAAESRMEMVYITSLYQPAVRYLEYHGMVLLFIVSVGSLLFPRFYASPAHSPARMWTIVVTIAFSSLFEAGLFVAFRETEARWIGTLLLVPYLALLTACVAWVFPWKPWRPLRDPSGRTDRMGKFVRAGLVWLVVSILMTIALPFWGMLMETEFSHAFHGATRQAFTVGFATLIIMGFAAKVVPNLNNIFPNALPSLRASFVLVNLGLVMHILANIASDLWPVATKALPVAGVLQYIGIAIWSGHLLRCIWRGWRQRGETPASSRPGVRLAVLNAASR